MSDIQTLLKTLRLRAPERTIQALLEHARTTHLGHMQLLEKLAATEREHCDAINLHNRLRDATLGTFTTIDNFDWDHPTTINRALYEQLHGLDFIDQGENILFRGGCGLGKTTLAKNLAHQALLKGHSVRFGTLANIMADLLKQESVPALQRRMRRYSHPKLLVIDELGYMTADARAADILFNLISHRNRRVSTIITTNLPYKQWDTVFPGATSLVPLVDRFGEACHLIEVDGPSWRDKQGQAFRGKTKVKKPRT